MFWKVRMKTYIQSLGFDLWDFLEEEYQRPLAVVTKEQRKEFTYNANEMNAFLACLPESQLVKLLDCTSAKAIWDKMSSCYKVGNKVKKSKLQWYRMKF